MGDYHYLGRKVKGKLQQFQGTLQQQNGQGLKGGIQKIKGKANEALADLEAKSARNNPRRRLKK